MVDVELLAGHRVDTNNGALALDGLPANWSVTNSRELGLGDGRMQCPETLEALFELGRETIVGLNLGQERVSPPPTSGWSRMKKVVPGGCNS